MDSKKRSFTSNKRSSHRLSATNSVYKRMPNQKNYKNWNSSRSKKSKQKKRKRNDLKMKSAPELRQKSKPSKLNCKKKNSWKKNANDSSRKLRNWHLKQNGKNRLLGNKPIMRERKPLWRQKKKNRRRKSRQKPSANSEKKNWPTLDWPRKKKTKLRDSWERLNLESKK